MREKRQILKDQCCLLHAVQCEIVPSEFGYECDTGEWLNRVICCSGAFAKRRVIRHRKDRFILHLMSDTAAGDPTNKCVKLKPTNLEWFTTIKLSNTSKVAERVLNVLIL